MAPEPFALWLTGLPGCGKSAIARALLARLHAEGVNAAHLESDVLRTQLTPHPRYDDAERELFYGALVHLGLYVVGHGVPVLFDATAHRRAWRAAARRAIGRFAEVYVDTPLEVCAARDPKGLYRSAREGRAPTLPGAAAAYEAPAGAELVIHGAHGTPEEGARTVLAWLETRRWIDPGQYARREGR